MNELSLTAETNEAEAMLLRRFAQTGDAEAFGEIAHHYAGLVYSTCLRITRDAQHAADAAQETFFHLLKNAGRISGSLAGWLHQVATRRAIDLMRRENARQRREQAYAELPTEANEWADIAPQVDAALNELEPELHEILILHFLQGRTASSIAAARGLSQPTVSRRIQQGLEALRARLREKDVLVTVVALGALLPQAMQAAPAEVMEQLGRMAMTGPGLAATKVASVPAQGLGLKVAAAMAVLVGVGGYWAYHSKLPAPTAPVAVQEPVPKVSSGQTGAERVVAPEAPKAAPLLAALESKPTTPVQPVAAPLPSPSEPVPASAPKSVSGGGWTEGPGGLRWGIPSATKPEGAVWRFVLALRQSPEQMQAAFVPDAPQLARFVQLLQSPRTDEEKQLALCLHSIGIPVQILQTNQTAEGLRVRYYACVRSEFVTEEGGKPKVWKVGDRFEMETRLQEVGSEWKVAGF